MLRMKAAWLSLGFQIRHSCRGAALVSSQHFFHVPNRFLSTPANVDTIKTATAEVKPLASSSSSSSSSSSPSTSSSSPASSSLSSTDDSFLSSFSLPSASCSSSGAKLIRRSSPQQHTKKKTTKIKSYDETMKELFETKLEEMEAKTSTSAAIASEETAAIQIEATALVQLTPDARHKQFPSIYSPAIPKLWEVGRCHIGTYVHVPDLAKIPATLRKPIAAEMDRTGNYVFMRGPLFSALHQLKAFSQTTTPSGYVMCMQGERGCGKSIGVATATTYAMQAGWLCLTTVGEEFPNDPFGLITVNKDKPTIFDQSRLTLRFFRNLRDHQAATLKKIQLKCRSYSLKSENVTRFVTLFDLVSHGSHSVTQSSEVLYDFVEEIRRTTETRVFVGIDNMNYWDQNSAFLHPKTFLPLPSRQLALVDAFSSFVTDPPVNGFVIFALTSGATMKFAKDYYKSANRLTHCLRYSDEELVKCLRHYRVSGVHSNAVTPQVYTYMQAISGAIPVDAFIQAQCMPL
eukprot:TRINITY_DN281_c0_g1_i1.p1 TRINITY_DN281_c0_g1~~TRINITY_DN281_c0_g1_i1.p1  ORF type:complete len:516 (-),score=135.65 TRINITY_DN281_c0_g1_i1:167-1714(-)